MPAQNAPRNNAETPVYKGYVMVRGRPLHYVRQGRGPAAVLLHASPCSAKVMAPLQDLWGAEFTTFAFDLPGFGLSALPDAQEITIQLLGDVIAEGMRALGITQAALYGRHTGASVCLAIAVQHPDLAACLVTDGLPVFANPYSDDRLKQYLTPITPSPDGTHLPWTLFRYRDQHVFWPWDAADLDHRSDADLPDIDFLHRGMVEMVEAAETYAPTYRAAFRYATLDFVGDVQCPAVYGNRPGDSQYKTIPLYPEWAPVHVMSRDPDVAAVEELEILRQWPATGAVPDWASRFGGIEAGTDYIATRHGMVHAIGQGLSGAGVPQIYLPDMPGAAHLNADRIATLAGQGPVLALDLAGCNESPAPGRVGVGLWCDQIADVLDHMGWDRVELVADGLAAAVAVACAGRMGDRIAGVVLRSPPLLDAADRAAFDQNPAPEILPAPDGGYLLRLWQHLRDQQLWYPWFDTARTAIRRHPMKISATALNRRAIAILKQPQHYSAIWDALLAPNLAAALPTLSTPVRIETDPADVFHPAAARHLADSSS